MKSIILDTDLKSKIGDLKEDVQLCDEAGHVIGFVLPAEIYRRMFIEMANTLVSDEELEQSFAESGGQTLAEIKRELGMG
jgi:hypothetical protein